jgi:mono/diheme cytochrome c family protein
VRRYLAGVLKMVVGVPSLACAMLASAADAPPDFNRDIRPILSHNCFSCHGPDEHDQQAGLRLDDRDAALSELESGVRAIVPGRPDASEAIVRIESRDPDSVMPPPHTNHVLTAKQKELLAAWIAAGADYEPHWAFVAPRRHEPPAPQSTAWPINWIDRFVLSKTEAKGIAPAPDADPVTLLRRLSLDLTGLPPAPEEVQAYLSDTDPQRYERAVDRLLTSPRHAERMASWWLDLVRYADTVGYHGDQEHAVSPYRDWVIKAFLENLRFDRFTLLQLAGDLVEPEVGEHADDRLVASAYNRLLQTSHEAGVQPREYRAIYQADRIRNVSAVWMGATMGCAQCHDHKYDPYTMRDFYSLGAFFADIDDEEHLRKSVDASPTVRAPEISVVGPFDGDGRERRVMVTRALASPREVRILPRGDWNADDGPLVVPAVPESLGRIAVESRATRADLARWLVSPVAAGGAGEFTARVTVNRIWSLFFGAGLCRSVGDFGGQGELPDHPELLDALAVEFSDSGWDVRAIIRLIVTSRAYRQSSEASRELLDQDPENRLLARQGRWRLPAEAVRDTALAASGLLVERLGGESVHPYQPAGYYRHLNFPKREYRADKDDRQWRRGLYVHWQRMFLHPQLQAFDAPNREECTAARPRSNTPKAALVLLNDPTFVEAARKLAELAVERASSDATGISYVWSRVLSRPPTSAEQTLVAGVLSRRREEFRANRAAAAALVGVGFSPHDKQIDVAELAAWTAVARIALNLHEAIGRF